MGQVSAPLIQAFYWACRGPKTCPPFKVGGFNPTNKGDDQVVKKWDNFGPNIAKGI